MLIYWYSKRHFERVSEENAQLQQAIEDTVAKINEIEKVCVGLNTQHTATEQRVSKLSESSNDWQPRGACDNVLLIDTRIYWRELQMYWI